MLAVTDDIFLIDSGFIRPGLAACYLVVESGRAAVIETGTGHSVPRILAALAERDLDTADVDLVVVTHVHLDHAAGAGALMAELPNAVLCAHPRGARHLIDPTRLVAGATEVYGEAFMRANYGDIVPIPAARVIEAPEGARARLAGHRDLVFWDTPGHARHHCCVWDEASRAVFTGDVFGLAYRELDSSRGPLIFPTTSPVQFDPDAMHASIDRVRDAEPSCVLLTHYGRVDNVAELAADLHELVDASVAVARAAPSVDAPTEIASAIMTLLLERARDHGCPLDVETTRNLLAMDVELNAQGLSLWLADAGKKK